jgi:hypothetical protein
MKNKIILSLMLVSLFGTARTQSDECRVLMHYMGWFGAGNTGNHWVCGQAGTPLTGYYNSQSWATIAYHMLLSWSCGIDGLVINVKDGYDARTLDMIVQTLTRLYEIDSTNFKYSISVSYDDQGFPDEKTAESKFTYLRDNILPKTKSFVRYDGVPVLFLFQYGALTADQYHTALHHVFPVNTPVLIRNEIDPAAMTYASSFYPWVQPGGSGWNGSNWGQNYLTWYYATMHSLASTVGFTCGGVWAGFNDSINRCWGLNRGIYRQNGEVYNNTWSYLENYTGNPPMKFAYLETWNDWNEGTELEPSKELRYQYLKLTVDHVNTFKDTNIVADTVRFGAAVNIYKAATLIEEYTADSAIYYPLLYRSISAFVQNRIDQSFSASDSIINGLLETDLENKTSTALTSQIDIFPNPAQFQVKLRITVPQTARAFLSITDSHGKVVETLFSGYLPEGEKTFIWNTTQITKGIYFILMKVDGTSQLKKVIIV